MRYPATSGGRLGHRSLGKCQNQIGAERFINIPIRSLSQAIDFTRICREAGLRQDVSSSCTRAIVSIEVSEPSTVIRLIFIFRISVRSSSSHRCIPTNIGGLNAHAKFYDSSQIGNLFFPEMVDFRTFRTDFRENSHRIDLLHYPIAYFKR